MKSKLINSILRISLLVFCFGLLIPFQNCAVYESDGRKVFESSLEEVENKGCYPYIDTNIAMGYLGVVDGSLVIYKAKLAGEDAHTCDFRTENPSFAFIDHVNCKISVGSGDNAVILKQDGESAFTGIVPSSIWTGTVRQGFVGTTHAGYVTLDVDSMFTVRYLALESNETKGVACAVRLSSADYADATKLNHVKASLSNMAQEMAIGNEQ